MLLTWNLTVPSEITSAGGERHRSVGELSDAYQLTLGGDVMVTYLLEVTRRPGEADGG